MTQEEALKILKTGVNVFLTGEPGAGKSHTINEYVRYLKECDIEPSITASTGIAATHIHGMTIHAWSGIGIANYLTPVELDRIATKEHVSRRIRSARVLIIDEVSMLASNTLDMVDAVCREVRQNSLPFGGLQVVLVGDFFQLPPVVRSQYQASASGQDSFYSDEPASIFAYGASAWARSKLVVCYLTEQHRQDDADFLSVLAAIRTNGLTDEHRTYITARVVTAVPEGVTKLYSHNADVDRINAEELKKLPGSAKRHQMVGHGRDTLVENLKRGCLSPEILELKEGAAVMFTKNSIQGGFVNGTLGTVVGFEAGTNNPEVEMMNGRRLTVEPLDWNIEDGGRVLATVTQVPLRLAWAMTVHKSQGMSMDAAIMDLSQAFEYGQGYVALSRVRRLTGLHLLGINRRALEVHPEILEIDAHFRTASDDAAHTFSSMPAAELAVMHANFVRASGGKIPDQVKEKKQKKEKKVKVEKPAKAGEKLAAIREKHPNAYMPWSDEDDEALTAGFENDTTINALAKEFGRKPGAIRSRLVKLGLIEEE